MARQGVPLAAVVSFHGALATATPATPGSVKAKVLVEHGGADSFIPAQQIADFKAEMDQAGVDYRFVELPGAKHGFSNPDADAHKAHGLDLGYQKEADERSWADMQALFKEVLAK
ncbi:Dienelactone hydrolase family protein [compost metagenome]